MAKLNFQQSLLLQKSFQAAQKTSLHRI